MEREIDTEKLAAALLRKCAQYAVRVSANEDLTGAQKRRLVDLKIVFGMVAIRESRAANTDQIEG